MPTPHVSPDQMAIGRKSRGKHWTAAEVAARQAAAEKFKRARPVQLRVPAWLDQDARRVWYRVIRQTRDLELLDILDTEMLAIYCDAVARYRQFSRGMTIQRADGTTVGNDEVVKTAQAWARIVAAYADKLGLSPAARARLAKRIADEEPDTFSREFDG